MLQVHLFPYTVHQNWNASRLTLELDHDSELKWNWIRILKFLQLMLRFILGRMDWTFCIEQSHTCWLSGSLYVFFFSQSQPSLFCLSPGVPEGTASVKVQLLPSLASGEAASRVTKVSSHTPQGINGSMPSITGYAGAPGKCFQICVCVCIL